MNTRELATLILSGCIVCGFGFVIIAWMVYPPTERNDLLISLVTTLGTGYLVVINYWFGPKPPAATEPKP